MRNDLEAAGIWNSRVMNDKEAIKTLGTLVLHGTDHQTLAHP